MKKWTIEDSKELYNINGWGTFLFRHQRTRQRLRDAL